uniref:formylglycine-generating enzyme family protein n=1 Tax=Alicyclobacillus cellulosilyticus TaxID=1003997 RepID=UPI00357102A7
MHQIPISPCCGVSRNSFDSELRVTPLSKSSKSGTQDVLEPTQPGLPKGPGAPAESVPVARQEKLYKDMILLPGGEFLMGTDSNEGFPQDGEGPVHKVFLDPFYISPCAVTNAEFAAFVEATGYRTDAERYGWSFVFYSFVDKRLLEGENVTFSQQAPWWVAVPGATWRTPEGPGSDIGDRMDHPVVHVSWNDAVAYCKWAGVRLPTEAEWEYAARGGLVQKRYAWGDILHPNGEHRCNIWQGKFPEKNLGTDGYLGTAPAKSFQPNGYGLYNVCGNVWEWCADWFAPDYFQRSPYRNPKGPAQGKTRVIRGGSYLCHRSYCNRYRVAARSSNTPDSSSGHCGFRVAADA